jgi:hypothetical protein
VEVREVRVRVVDARQEADLPGVEQAADAAVGALRERGVQAEPRLARQRGRRLAAERAAQVGQPARLVERGQRREQVAAARQEDGDEHGGVGRRDGLGVGGLEHARGRQRRRGVQRQAADDDLAPGQVEGAVRAAEVVAALEGIA